MNVLSLFSGIGGLDLGLERAGMTIAGQVEIDPWCRKVLAKHWPEVPRHDDVRTAAGWWGDRPADLVCGGFPCQPVSLAGKGLAQADERWLWPAFADVIRALRPRFVLVENVPGLLGRGMGDVLGDLAAIGYDAEWDCISAADVGAPHLRKRIWIIAYPDAESRRRGNPRRNDGLGLAGLDAHVADAERDGLEGSEHALAGQGAATWGRRPADAHSPRTLAYSYGWRLAEQQERDGRPQPWIFSPFGDDALGRDSHAADTNGEPMGWLAESRRERGFWVTEPDVGRVAHGIPARVDRLRGLGNAVVPQVAEHIGRIIMNTEAA